jgi:two-component system NarL family sensor kinase
MRGFDSLTDSYHSRHTTTHHDERTQWYNEKTGVCSTMKVRGRRPEGVEKRPGKGVEIAAYRIVQEALTNVVRHAQAHTCTVRLQLSDILQVEVSDDGVGFPSERRAGVGLLSMRERAAELGGSCVIESLPGAGVRMCARLPLPKEETDGTAPRLDR